jgi:hypothetical protein
MPAARIPMRQITEILRLKYEAKLKPLHRRFYGGIGVLTTMAPDSRVRQPRDVSLSCGNQSTNISVIHRRRTLCASRS